MDPRFGITMNKLVLVAAGLSMLSIAGCSVPQEVRDGARLMAAYTGTVQSETERYAKSRHEIAKARQASMNRLEMSTVSFESWKAVRLGAWELTPANTLRSKVYVKLINASEDDLRRQVSVRELAAEHEQRIRDAKSHVDIRSEKLAETAKLLAQLAEEQSLEDDVRFYVDFFKGVRKTVDALRDEIKMKSENASAAAADKAASVDDEVPPTQKK